MTPDTSGGDHSASGPAGSMWSVRSGDGSVATGWALMPLRLFLGVTFLYAGCQKLADPQFFNSASLFGIHAQLVGASRSSPIHALVGHLVGVSSGLGVVIAIGEVAIGLGVLVGLWVRVAGVAGMALSFGLFLTISFHSSPYFTGSDIVFFFAWTPLVLAGAAGAPALDTWLAERAAATEQAPAGHPARAAGGVPRRSVLSKGALTGITAAVVLIGSGVVAALGRAVGGTSTAEATPTTAGGGTSTTSTVGGSPEATTSTTTAAPAEPSGTSVGAASSVPVGGSASFTVPSTGDPGLIIQRKSGDFVAFDAVCPHEGCTVAYAPSARIIACPCHGSEFNAQTGAVIQGPAVTGLTSITVIKGADGDLYVPK